MGHIAQLDAALNNVALQQGPRGFTFDDLARPGRYQGATIGEVTAWLAHARSTDFVEDLGFDLDERAEAVGARRYRISARA